MRCLCQNECKRESQLVDVMREPVKEGDLMELPQASVPVLPNAIWEATRRSLQDLSPQQVEEATRLARMLDEDSIGEIRVVRLNHNGLIGCIELRVIKHWIEGPGRTATHVVMSDVLHRVSGPLMVMGIRKFTQHTQRHILGQGK